MSSKMSFGEKLKVLLLVNNKNQSEIAKICKINPATISIWINKKDANFYPKVEHLIVIARYFELSLDELVNEDIGMRIVKSKNEV